MTKSSQLPFRKFSFLQTIEDDELHEGLLYFAEGNSKLRDGRTTTFSLPAGYSCPGAKDCLAWFDRKERRLLDGPHAQHRCFAASIEAARASVRASVDRNLALLRYANTRESMADLIDLSLPAARFTYVRVHVDGDFFSKDYFLAWMDVARRNPKRLFYAYTKSLPLWVTHRAEVPENFVLTASRGGKWDSLIEKNGLRSARVVFHPDEAKSLGLEIDHDDNHARVQDGKDFALLIHGVQAAGSEASAAIKRLKREGVRFSYKSPRKKTLRAGGAALDVMFVVAVVLVVVASATVLAHSDEIPHGWWLVVALGVASLWLFVRAFIRGDVDNDKQTKDKGHNL
jgi:hypothetical protein